MKLAIIGYGKMGRLLEVIAKEKAYEIVARIDPYDPAADYPDLAAADRLRQADIALEFSRPNTAFDNIKELASLGISMIVGSTGWYHQLPTATSVIAAAGVNLVYSPNFSLGVNLFYQIAAYAAKLFDRFAEYDVGGYEIHHNKKADSPSGTAKALVKTVLAQMSRKTTAVYDCLDRPPAAEALHFASLRVGAVPGSHSLVFDSQADSLELRHSARNREGFARGAILAAEWLAARPASGTVYTMDDVLAELLD